MKKKDINEEALGMNPFVVPLNIPIRRVSKVEYDDRGTPKYGVYDLELTQNVKFFIGPSIRELLYKMPGSSAQLLLWIMQKLEAGKDYIHINRKVCMNELGISSQNTYKASVKALCDKTFLAAIYMVPDVYFVNPQIFFHGNRAKAFPNNIEEYVPKKSKENHEEN